MVENIKEKIEDYGLKNVLWKSFVWFIIIALIVSPIAIYLV